MRPKYLPLIHILVWMLFSVMLLQCKKPAHDDTSNNNGNNPPPTIPPVVKTDSTLNEHVFIVDSTKLILTSDTLALNQGHLEYRVVGTAPVINVNDILVGPTVGGYIRKVSSISQQQDKITIESTQGTMEDVFNNASFHVNTNMEGLENARLMSGFQFDVSGKVIYKDGPLSLTLDKGVIDVDGDWNFGFSFKKARLDTFEMSNKNMIFNGQLDLTVDATQAITVAERSSVLGRIAKSNIFFVNGVPVVLYTEVELRCVFSATIGATVKRKLQMDVSSTSNIGVKYINSQWQNIFDHTASSTLTASDRSGNVNAEVKMAIVPYISFRLYRILGPYASVGLRELIKGKVASPSLDWDFYAGAWIQTILGVRAQILGRSLFDFNKEWNTDTLNYQTPYKIERTSGDNQTGQANQFLDQPLRVRVLDKKDASQSNVPVYFTVTAGGGAVETPSMMTDADGYAQTRWKIGTQNVIQTVEAKVKKADGSTVGEPVDFAASANPPVVATIATSSVSSIAQTSAVAGGSVTDDGGAAITARGVCWSTSANPTIVNDKTVDGSGMGNFTSSLKGLTGNTTYYLRAYATNIAGTAYGQSVSFKTSNNSLDHTKWYGYYRCSTWDPDWGYVHNFSFPVEVPLGSAPLTLELSTVNDAVVNGTFVYVWNNNASNGISGNTNADHTQINWTSSVFYADAVPATWTISGNEMRGSLNTGTCVITFTLFKL